MLKGNSRTPRLLRALKKVSQGHGILVHTCSYCTMVFKQPAVRFFQIPVEFVRLDEGNGNQSLAYNDILWFWHLWWFRCLIPTTIAGSKNLIRVAAGSTPRNSTSGSSCAEFRRMASLWSFCGHEISSLEKISSGCVAMTSPPARKGTPHKWKVVVLPEKFHPISPRSFCANSRLSIPSKWLVDTCGYLSGHRTQKPYKNCPFVYNCKHSHTGLYTNRTNLPQPPPPSKPPASLGLGRDPRGMNKFNVLIDLFSQAQW